MIGTDHSNGIGAQLSRVIAALRTGPKSTVELRRDFDVMMPAARVHQLRGKGHEIITLRTTETTECGKSHQRVAKYVLIASANDSNN